MRSRWAAARAFVWEEERTRHTRPALSTPGQDLVKTLQNLCLMFALFAAIAPAARASDVFVVDGGRTALRDDPALPAGPDPFACGAPPRAIATAAAGPTVIGTLRELGLDDEYEA